MIRRLRARLFAICAVLTSAVLIASVAAVLFFAEREYRTLSRSVFRSLNSAIVERLLAGGELRGDWLAAQEVKNNLVIAVEDNGVALFFRGGWSPPTDRAALVARAREAAAEGGAVIRGESGERYHCADTTVQAGRARYRLTVLQLLCAEDRQMARQRLWYLLLAAAGVLLLCGVSWVLAGLAARPVAKSRDEQNAFLAAASHELRAPVAAISVCAEAIRIDGAKAERYIGSICGECARLGRLVDDLLVLARADAPGWRLERGEVEPDTLLIEAVEQLAPFAREHGHALRLDLPGETELPVIAGDAGRLRQALGNLIVNAACYAGGSGPIEVQGRRTARGVEIAVTDHGRGIPAKERRRVFERFYRADGARSDKAHFGLGLSIAREIARLHGGRLTLAETPGGGCAFTLSLPVR